MPLRIRKEVQDLLKASLDGTPEAVRAPAPQSAGITSAQTAPSPEGEPGSAVKTPRVKPMRKAPPPETKAASRKAHAVADGKTQKRKSAAPETTKPKITKPKTAKNKAPARRRKAAARPSAAAARTTGTAVGFRNYAGEIETISALFDMLVITSSDPARVLALKSLTERYLSESPSDEKLDQVRMLLHRQTVIVRKEREAAAQGASRAATIDAIVAQPEATDPPPAPDRLRRGEVVQDVPPAPEAKAGNSTEKAPASASSVPPLPPEAKRRGILAWLRRRGGSGGGSGTGSEDPAQARRPIGARIKTVLMASVWLGVGSFTLTYAGALVYVNWMRLETDTALISGNVEPVNAPFDGSITTLLVRPGDRLGEGQRFMILEDPEVEKQVKLAGVKVERAREDLRLKQAELESEKIKRDEYISISRNKMDKIVSDIETLEQLQRVARDRFERLSDLFKKGIVIRPRLEEASDKLAELTTQLTKARINRKERESQMEGVLAGHFFDGNQLVGKMKEAEAAVVRAAAEIDLALEELQALQQRRQVNKITASHDSRVLKVLRNEGASVKRGDTMLVVERLDERMVHAFLRQEEINRVAIGDEAVVFVPALRARATARVTNVDRNAAFLDDVDARYSWKIARDGGPKPTDRDRTARVTLRFEGIDKDIVDGKFELGMPTVVSFPRRSVSTVFSSFADVGPKL